MLHQGRWWPVQFYFPQRAQRTYPQPRMSDDQVNQKLMEGYIGNLSAIQSMNMISNAQMSITSTIFK